MSLDVFIDKHRLPDVYIESADRCYLPFISWLETRIAVHRADGLTGAYVLGINGAQGTGKSTLADLVVHQLSPGYRVVVLSIDDIYKTKAEREAMARDVHPMFATRGVPGTHDVALGIDTISALQQLAAGELYRVPRFDKSVDDRCAEADWAETEGPVDVIILEGWCVGSQAVADEDLAEPVNALESERDPDGTWRRRVNDALRSDYGRLFAELDSLCFLKSPDFDCIYRWRLEQEHKLRDRRGDASGVMSDDEVATFIQFYERITEDNLKRLPDTADVVIELTEDHSAVALRL